MQPTRPDQDRQELKEKAHRQVDALADLLWQTVITLYENPETAFQEFQSSALLANVLQEHGFEVERGLGGLETAFRATQVGASGHGPTVAILAEYDALPALGHACGHNLIAAAALGAGLALNSVMPRLPGRVQVVGTPAEEGGGGKRILAQAGAFAGVDAAMMFHPARKNMVTRPSLASLRLKIEYFGRPAHAAASPEKGINALDACLLLFNSLNALRQHIPDRSRLAGIITHGGDAANIVPAYTAAEFSVRGATGPLREALLQRVLACAEGAAQATGCRLAYDVQEGYENMLPNPTLARLFAANAATLGRTIVPPEPDEPIGSTDMGNVSQIVPAIHPYLATVDPEVAGHTIEFREQCVSPAGRASMLDAAKTLAATAIDLLVEPALLQQAKDELADMLAATNG